MEQITITKKTKVNVSKLRVKALVRHWDGATVNGLLDEEGTLIPCRECDVWCPTIDISTGVIENWRKGTVAEIHYKVCDNGVYELYDETGDLVDKKRGYVPSILCPQGGGYGDYIIMQVDQNGKIEHWNVDLEYFESEE